MNKVVRGRMKLLLPFMGLTLCWGCATTQETGMLQQNVGTLYQQMQNLEARVQKIERQVSGAEGGRAMNVADLYARVEELQVKLAKVNGKVEGQERTVEDLKQSVSSISSRTPSAADSSGPKITFSDGSSSPAEPLQPPAGQSGESRPGAMASTPPQISQPPSAPTAPVRPAPAANPEKAQYDRAFRLFQQGQYDGARKEFQDFVGKYPSSDLSGSALFWIGEGYYSEKRYREAIASYQQVLDHYPKTNKVPYALLKQANAWEHLGDSTAARILYERLTEQYPDSPQAQIAGKKLKDIR